MRDIKAELLVLCKVAQDDVKKFISWVWGNRAKNSFDMKVISYPRACMARAFDEEGTLLMVPVQPVLMLESVAPKPDLTDKERVLALYRVTEMVEKAMNDSGMPECYFLCKEGDPLADVAKGHQWQEVTGFRVLKRQIDWKGIPLSDVEVEPQPAVGIEDECSSTPISGCELTELLGT